jgi:predicted RNA-binding protein with PIN domain
VANEPDPGRRRKTRWLVDGMNVIGSKPDGWWKDPDRAVHRLVRSLAAFAKRTGDHLTVVFDRRPKDLEPGLHDGVIVAFAQERGPNAADHEIVRMVREDQRPPEIVVITSDDQLAHRVLKHGARVASSGGFRRRLDRSSDA